MNKMYCLIREDLKPSHKACQGGHAIAQYFLDHDKPKNWNNGTMILLKTKDEKELKKWKEKLNLLDIKHSEFIEPDLNNSLTAISCIHTGEIFKKLKLL